MTQVPHPPPLVLTSAAMLALPAVVLVVYCLIVLYSLARDAQVASFSGLAWLGMVLFPLPAALLVLAE
jgi:hypothetical protein